MKFSKMPRSLRLLIVLVLYVGLFAGHVTGVNYYVENYSEKVDSREVVVTVNEIPLHTVINEEDVAMKSIRLSDLVDGAMTDPAEIVGKETQAPMGVNEQFHPSKINTIVKKTGEMILEIPSEWVLSFPKSLRRMDKISFLPVLQKNANGRVDIPISASPESAPVPVIADDLNAKQLSESRKLLENVTVAYFKDNSANEVTDSTTVTEFGPRLSSSNLGARLEVAMSPEQWDMLQKLTQKNYKFVISYQ
ncbi:SAF domain-containing protein [Paenibacillus abyssi]|uniref:SAF domain-containing protein n=1 Tax=Paenibacillus abyssi TaxID=1340531 RepID=A0A917G2N1_9BACL|nr:SAF domain-containing protein [Paenibacillus abyssi]GGG18774.1 hypothetical protein GCM10010916_39460 [Paenibacillus abyssi]